MRERETHTEEVPMKEEQREEDRRNLVGPTRCLSKKRSVGTSYARERHTQREEVPMKEEQRRNLV